MSKSIIYAQITPVFSALESSEAATIAFELLKFAKQIH